MHKITPKRIAVTNFMSIGPRIDFDFEKHSGFNYVFGINHDIEGTKNGSGKTSLFVLAILYALFGQMPKDINNKYLANRQTAKNKNCEIEFELKINEDMYLIETGMIMPRFTTYLRLWKKNGDKYEEISKSSIKETRQYFETQILKTTFETFRNSIILAGNDSNKFFKMRKSEKRTFIENIFNLNVFGEMLTQVRDDKNALDREILKLENSITQIRDSIDRCKNNEKNFEIDKTTNLSKMKEKIDFKNKRIVELGEEIKVLEKDTDATLTQSLNTKNNELQKLIEIRGTINSTLRVCENEISNSHKLIDKHIVVLDTVCEDCKDKLKNKLNIKEAEDIITVEEAKLVKYNEALGKIKIKYDSLNNDLITLKSSVKKHEDNIKTINHNTWVVNHLKEDLLELDKQYKEEEDKHSPFKEMIENYQDQIKVDEGTLSKYYTNRKYLELMETIVSEDGAKKFIIKDLVNVLNGRIKTYLNEMGASYTAIFDNTFDCEFITETGVTSYENFSNGEKARIDISILFAFRDILSNLGNMGSSILVLDEFIDTGLDDYAINAVIKILKNIIDSSGQTVFLISHRECLNAEDFNNIIKLEKTKGFTKITADTQGGIYE